MILELHPLGDYTDNMQVKVHLTPNEWVWVTCVHGTTFPGFRLHPVDVAGRMLVVRTDQSMTAERVYNTLRVEFANNVSRFAQKYLSNYLPPKVTRKHNMMHDYVNRHGRAGIRKGGTRKTPEPVK